MLNTPAIDTVMQSMMDSTDLKNGTAKKRPVFGKKKKLVPNSPQEEADEKRRGIKDTPAEEAAEVRMNRSK